PRSTRKPELGLIASQSALAPQHYQALQPQRRPQEKWTRRRPEYSLPASICFAPRSSAELHSARRWERPTHWTIRRPAEYNSAIQQIENLRYGREPAARFQGNRRGPRPSQIPWPQRARRVSCFQGTARAVAMAKGIAAATVLPA